MLAQHTYLFEPIYRVFSLLRLKQMKRASCTYLFIFYIELEFSIFGRFSYFNMKFKVYDLHEYYVFQTYSCVCHETKVGVAVQS